MLKILRVCSFGVLLAAGLGCESATLAQGEVETRPVGVKTQLQAGPWFMAPSNIEGLTINYLLTGEEHWRFGHPTKGDAYPAALIDAQTGLPTEIKGDGPAVGGWYFGTSQPKEAFAGDWVIELDGPGKVFPGLSKNARRVSDRRVEWTFSPGDPGIYPSLSEIKGPLTALRIYRAEDEERLRQGKIWSGKFVDEISKYHIVRTMDLQNANRIMVTKANEVPPLSYHFWGNRKESGTRYQSIPHAALVELAMEADVALWFQTSLFLGFPKDYADLAVDEKDHRHGDMRRIARDNLEAIVASDEWDKYADDVVAALSARGYPEDRPLYTSGLNEIWNFAGPFFWNTTYCDAIGEALTGDTQSRATHEREGYGWLMGRWMTALDDALARAGRSQTVVYVIESQTANPNATSKALDYAKRYIESKGRNWDDFAPRMGVALTTYWGGSNDRLWREFKSPDEWAKAIASNPEGTARAFADFQIDADAAVGFTPAWVVAKWRDHERQAAPYGVKLIGAYEGGPHQIRPKYIPRDWYTAYLWGADGARVNDAVNDRLAAVFPGVILSNYALDGGVGGDPWFDGLYDEDNPLKRSWVKYQRP